MSPTAHERRAAGDLSGFLQAAPDARIRPEVVSLVRSQVDLLGRLRSEPATARERRPLLGDRAHRPGLRVLHLVDNALPDVASGYTLRTDRLAAAQRRMGIDAMVVPLWSPSDVGRRPWDYPSEDAYLEARVATVLGAVGTRPDLVHAHSEHRNAEVGRRVADLWDVPLVYEVRGLRHESWAAHHLGGESSEWYELERLREQRAWRLADGVVATTRLLADRIEAEAPGTTVRVCRNGVDAAAFRFRPWSWSPGDAVRLGYVGRLSAFEGLDHLIESGRRLADAGRVVEVVIVGDGPDRQRLLDVATSVGGVPRLTVRIEGPVTSAEAVETIAGLTVAAVPRLDTPVTRQVAPMKPLESLGLGIPTVVSDLPALREICGEGGVFVCEPGSAESLAASIDDVLGSAGRIEGRLSAGAAWVEEHRTWAASARSALAAYGGNR